MTHVRYYLTGTTNYKYKMTHSNNIVLNHLLPDTAYSWDLNNFCNGEWTPYTGNGSFTTLPDTIPPPTCIPTNLADTNVTAHSVDLSWGGITGPTHLRYYPTGTTNYIFRDTHMNHITLHNLLPNTPYSWDLSNFCNGEWTPFTGDGTFTTLPDIFKSGIVAADEQSTTGLSDLTVHPNPIREKAIVTFTSADNGSYLFKIIDITGRELKTGTRQASTGTNTFELNLSDNQKGIYFLYIRKGSELNHIKLLKE
jgi:hypothetical protein